MKRANEKKLLKDFYFPELNLYCEADIKEPPKVETKFIEKYEGTDSHIYKVKRVVLKVKKCVKLIETQLNDNNPRDKIILNDLKHREDANINTKVDKMYIFIDLEKEEKNIDDSEIPFEEKEQIINTRIRTLENEIKRFTNEKNTEKVTQKNDELKKMMKIKEDNVKNYQRSIKSQLFDK